MPPVDRIATVGRFLLNGILPFFGIGVLYVSRISTFLAFLALMPILYPVFSLRTITSLFSSSGLGSSVPSNVPSGVVILTLSPAFASFMRVFWGWLFINLTIRYRLKKYKGL